MAAVPVLAGMLLADGAGAVAILAAAAEDFAGAEFAGVLGMETLTPNRAGGAKVILCEPGNAGTGAGAVELSATGRCVFVATVAWVWSCSADSVPVAT